MAITLTRFSAGMVAYVAAFNNNSVVLETAINALQAGGGGGGGVGTGFLEVWDRTGLVGASAFIVTLVSDTHLSLTSGAVWNLGTQKLGRNTSATQLSFVGNASGTYFLNIDGAGGVTVSTVSGTTAAYSIYFSAASFGSATRLVQVLLHGDDYNRMLSSLLFGSGTRVADRLSSLENALTLDAMYAQSGTSGAQWSYKRGQVRNNNVIFSAAASFVSLPANSSFFVEVDPATGTVSVTSGGFTSGNIPIRFVQTSAGVIISNDDRRAWATLAFSGGGGGVAGLTISGTTNPAWTGATSVLSAGSAVDVRFIANRGTGPQPEIRWRETASSWQFTTDGTSFINLVGIESLNIGTQQQTRFTWVASTPIVLNEPARGPSSAGVYSALLLSTHISTTATAIVLRGFMTDSNAGSTLSAGSVTGITFFVDSSTITNAEATKVIAMTSATIRFTEVIVPVSNQRCDFQVEASSDGAATLRFALVGFYDTRAGVGTTRLSGTVTSLAVCATSAATFSLSAGQFAAAMTRGQCWFLQTSASNSVGAGSLYDIELYGHASGATSQLTSALLFQATGIDASAIFLTRLPFYYEDTASTALIYLRISSAGTASGLWSLEMRCERFA